MDPMAATVKGFGKGKSPGFGKGFTPYGKGQPYFPQYSPGWQKGKGKGQESPPVFYGNCANCNLIGHKSADCPYLGKGFKGSCKGCGTLGHKKAQCPKGKGKDRSANSVEEESPGQNQGFNMGGGDEGDDRTKSDA